MKKIRTSTLSAATALSHTKVKRWAREFLGPDPSVSMQGGRARQYSLEDAWKIRLGGYLIASLGFEMIEAKQIIEETWQELKQHGLTPYSKDKKKRKITWNLTVYPMQVQGHFSYVWESRKIIKKLSDESGYKKTIEEIECYYDGLEYSPEGGPMFLVPTSEEWYKENPERATKLYRDLSRLSKPRHINLSLLLDQFEETMRDVIED